MLLYFYKKICYNSIMFHAYAQQQFDLYKSAFSFYEQNPNALIEIERFVMDEIKHFINLQLPELKSDYDEASYLYSFWKNYPPLDRGRSPVGDQFPWIEVGEQVFGNKLSRYFAANFTIRDAGLPSGSDDRCIISSERIKQILKITDSVWIFIDIKSAGPRDDFDHAVMSTYQVSGSGNWEIPSDGIMNDIIIAHGKRVSHNFMCSLSPIYVLSNGTVAPLVTFVVKPVYKMLAEGGQPLEKIKIANIPNGILLTKNPNYLKSYPSLFFPGKDDKEKDERKARARIDFSVLRTIADWRVYEMEV